MCLIIVTGIIVIDAVSVNGVSHCGCNVKVVMPNYTETQKGGVGEEGGGEG